MFKQFLSISLLAFLCALTITELSAQIKSEEHKVVVIEKEVDDQGKITERKVVKTGEEAKAYIQKMKEKGELEGVLGNGDGMEMTKTEKKQYKIHVKDDNGEEKEMTWDGEGEMPEEMKSLMESHEIDIDTDGLTQNTEKNKIIIIRKDNGEEGKTEIDFDEEEIPDDIKEMLKKEGIDIQEIIGDDGTKEIKVEVKDEASTPTKKKAQLGVQIEDHPQGVYISNVIPESSAADAGLRKGDIITSVDEAKMTSTQGLIQKIGSHEAGDNVTVMILRDRKAQTLSLNLKEKVEPFPFKTWDEVMKSGKKKNIEIEIEHEIIKEKK